MKRFLAWAISLGLHCLGAIALLHLPYPGALPPPQEVIEVEVIRKPPPEEPEPPRPPAVKRHPAHRPQPTRPTPTLILAAELVEAEPVPVIDLPPPMEVSITVTVPREAPRVKSPLPLSRVSQAPVPLGEVEVVYPAQARRLGVEGKVVLRLTVNPEGRVEKVEILDGPGFGLNQAAAEAARRLRFRPATLDGRPVAVRIRYTYTFVLTD